MDPAEEGNPCEQHEEDEKEEKDETERPNNTDGKSMPQEEEANMTNLTKRTGAPKTMEPKMKRHLQSTHNNREGEST